MERMWKGRSAAEVCTSEARKIGEKVIVMVWRPDFGISASWEVKLFVSVEADWISSPPYRWRVFRNWCYFLFLPSIVLLNRNDSLPVSIIWARSVIRSSSALHNRGLGNTDVHSENGRLVVMIKAARSARSEITWNRNSAPMSASGTYPTSSSAIKSYLVHLAIIRFTWPFCFASTSSLTSAAAVMNRRPVAELAQ